MARGALLRLGRFAVALDRRRAERAAVHAAPGRLAVGGDQQASVEQLEADGLMRAPGRAVIDAAKADGSWTLLEGPEQGIVPDDLARALADQPPAREVFDAFPPGVRKGC